MVSRKQISSDMHSIIFLSFLSGVCLQQASGAAVQEAPHTAPLHGKDHADAVPDSYMVSFKRDYSIEEHWKVIGKDLSGTPEFIRFSSALHGYAAVLDEETIGNVRRDVNVEFVETEQRLEHRFSTKVVEADHDLTTNGSTRGLSKRDYTSTVDISAQWNLQMIGAGEKLATPVYDGGQYEYLDDGGKGVNIYIMDTGVRTTHSDFGGRASNIRGLKNTERSPYCNSGTNEDTDGHGTHVAGIAAGSSVGIAKGANIINVKVICEGFTTKNVAHAIDEISKEHQNNRKNNKNFRGSIVNMSFGGYGWQYSLGQAIGWARWQGVNFVGAAGNDNKATDNDWPCYWSSVMCIAAVGSDYKKAPYSNYGNEIDYLAPGTDVRSLSYRNDWATAYMSGCSMSSPHVAGIAAIFVGWKGLVNGGADGYVYSNSLSGLSSGWWGFFSPNTKNYFATTGIRSKKKYPKEPFRWASDNPAAGVVAEAVVPIAKLEGDPVPVQASQTNTIQIATGVTTKTKTGNALAASEKPENFGLDKIGHNLNVGEDSETGPPMPASVLAALGLTALGGPAAPTQASAPKDDNKCHGIGGDYWVMSRDVAVDNAKTFCSQSAKAQTYNQGSVNELVLSVRNLKDDSKGPPDAPDCLGRFQNAVIDGCDGGDLVNNPHNYKFGSTLTTTDGWEYTMIPTSKQVNEVRCDLSYKFFLDIIEIRGKNLPDAKFGAEGEGLHSALSGCGAVTHWQFERTPNDVKFQWYAACHLPIGTKNCVGRAIQTAGGSSDGGCHGPGRRHAERDSIDDWPGYGDESKHVFGQSTHSMKRDSIDDWPGYGDDSKHVFGQSAYNMKRDGIGE